jgi:glycerol transport system ATP-binding protein
VCAISNWARLSLHIEPAQIYLFNADGDRIHAAPSRHVAGIGGPVAAITESGA